MTGMLATTRTRIDVVVPSANVSSVRISSVFLGSRSTTTSSSFDARRTETSRSTWRTPSAFANENLGWRRRPCTASHTAIEVPGRFQCSIGRFVDCFRVCSAIGRVPSHHHARERVWPPPDKGVQRVAFVMRKMGSHNHARIVLAQIRSHRAFAWRRTAGVRTNRR
jgi:hypothetical protein